MKLLLTLLLVLSFATVKAQLLAPDTVCIGKPFTVTSLDTSNTYTFSPNDTGLKYEIGNPDTVDPRRQLRYGSHIAMAVDGGNYYGFFLNSNFTIYRLSFGTNPNSSPYSVNLGNPGGLIDFNPQWIELAKDGNDWYGFVTSGTKIVRLNFGTSLSNTPVATAMDFTGHLNWAMQISVKKHRGQWVGFVSNYGVQHMTRLEFGSSLNNIPTAYNLADITFQHAEGAFTLYQQDNKWFILLTNIRPLAAHVVIRLNLGTDLLNNNPTVTGLGNPGIMNTPRGIILQPGCNSLTALVMNEPGYLVKLDFLGDITNMPVGTRVPNWSTENYMACLTPYWYNDTLYLTSCNYIKNAHVIQFPVASLNNGTTSANPAFTHTYNTIGSYQAIMLNEDKSGTINSKGYCKTIVVVDTPINTITAAGNLLSVPSTYKAYQWYLNGVAIPGATTYVWNAPESGIYSVEINNAGDCFTNTAPYNHAAVGVYDVQSPSIIQMYPNPATGIVNLDLHSVQGKVYITLYNIVGTKVHQYEAEGGKNVQLSLAHLPRGMYNVRVTTNTQNATSQLSLQ